MRQVDSFGFKMGETFLAAVFNKLSLAERREVWEGKEDTEEATLERIHLLWGQKETRYSTELAARWKTEGKNSSEAGRCKEAGNKAYSSGDYVEAIGQYNTAIRLGEKGEATGLVLGNRSAVWAALEKQDLVVKDVGAALEQGTPPHVVWRLLERRGRALKMRGEAEAAVKDLEDAMDALSRSNLAEDKRLAKKGELQRLVKDIRSCKTVKKSGEGRGGQLELPDRNPLYPTFSNAVKIEYEEGRGRFAVAKRAVRVGELLAREVAAVAMIEERRATSHCWCFYQYFQSSFIF